MRPFYAHLISMSQMMHDAEVRKRVKWHKYNNSRIYFPFRPFVYHWLDPMPVLSIKKIFFHFQCTVHSKQCTMYNHASRKLANILKMLSSKPHNSRLFSYLMCMEFRWLYDMWLSAISQNNMMYTVQHLDAYRHFRRWMQDIHHSPPNM